MSGLIITGVVEGAEVAVPLAEEGIVAAGPALESAAVSGENLVANAATQLGKGAKEAEKGIGHYLEKASDQGSAMYTGYLMGAQAATSDSGAAAPASSGVMGGFEKYGGQAMSWVQQNRVAVILCVLAIIVIAVAIFLFEKDKSEGGALFKLPFDKKDEFSGEGCASCE